MWPHTTGGNKSAAGVKSGLKGHIKTEVKSEPPSAPIDQLDDESVVVIKTEPGASQSAAGKKQTQGYFFHMRASNEIQCPLGLATSLRKHN